MAVAGLKKYEIKVINIGHFFTYSIASLLRMGRDLLLSSSKKISIPMPSLFVQLDFLITL